MMEIVYWVEFASMECVWTILDSVLTTPFAATQSAVLISSASETVAVHFAAVAHHAPRRTQNHVMILETSA